MKKFIVSFVTSLMFVLMSTPVWAIDTTQTYNSGILTLLFVGFCALLIVAQLVPACLALFGMTKDAVKNTGRKAIKVK